MVDGYQIEEWTPRWPVKTWESCMIQYTGYGLLESFRGKSSHVSFQHCLITFNGIQIIIQINRNLNRQWKEDCKLVQGRQHTWPHMQYLCYWKREDADDSGVLLPDHLSKLDAKSLLKRQQNKTGKQVISIWHSGKLLQEGRISRTKK